MRWIKPKDRLRVVLECLPQIHSHSSSFAHALSVTVTSTHPFYSSARLRRRSVLLSFIHCHAISIFSEWTHCALSENFCGGRGGKGDRRRKRHVWLHLSIRHQISDHAEIMIKLHKRARLCKWTYVIFLWEILKQKTRHSHYLPTRWLSIKWHKWHNFIILSNKHHVIWGQVSSNAGTWLSLESELILLRDTIDFVSVWGGSDSTWCVWRQPLFTDRAGKYKIHVTWALLPWIQQWHKASRLCCIQCIKAQKRWQTITKTSTESWSSNYVGQDY